MKLVFIGCRLLLLRHLLSPVSLRLGLLSLLIAKLHACHTTSREAAECPMTFLETGRCAEKGSSKQASEYRPRALPNRFSGVRITLLPEEKAGYLAKLAVVLIHGGLLRRWARLLLRES